ncbi:CCA tRNA nucleotidyltransferase [Solibacillus sp. R5-41]|uniref:CCA tRNA nucleotidyltransferase n=1 Tax=Solibacillus sp. R5-41 TaxID=2048654 RepID=UPI000C1274E6|nr:CCA tRNA nucleotidyltransferase [Solibacillus sp. R5-41]ATP39641.1 CCA tRNA nucleotidyltransferase [Solibacillus sp. R5-41]
MKFPKQWQSAVDVIAKIENAGYEAFIVGGAVRDYYLQKDSADVDVATSALPHEVQAIFSQTVDVGIDHGTVLVLDCGEPIEVTTYRTESTYSDHRRPDEVNFVRDLPEDLKRRDFTMNAMALHNSGQFVDLFNGRQDIDAKVIRAVGDAAERFQEDALRMLRAIRFSAQMDFSIEENTLKAIQEHVKSIKFIAMERIQVEISKIWTSPNPVRAIHYIQWAKLDDYLPGEFDAIEWEQVQTANRQVGWAYFCLVNAHDVSLLSVYRCSNKDKQFVKQVLHAYEKLQNEGWQRIDYLQFELDILQTAHLFATWQYITPTIPFEQIEKMKHALPIQHKNELEISGNDLLQWTPKKAGPWLQVALQAALLAVVNGQISNDKEQLKEWFHAFNNEG